MMISPVSAGNAWVKFIGSFLGGPDEVNGIYRVDDPNSFTVVADIGAFNVANPPDTEFEAPIGVQTSFQAFRGGFLVTDGHLNRMLRVTLDGDISVVRAFDNIVPVGLISPDHVVTPAPLVDYLIAQS